MSQAFPSSRAVLCSSALALLVTGAVLYAGPLDPPAGPVTSTYKTLTEVEPRIAVNATNTPGDADSLFKITQRGSYYLTGNITGVVGKDGIEIAASGVTLDLNGFSLVGVPGSFTGIYLSTTNARDICVRNGTVRGWPLDGIDFRDQLSTSSLIADVHASGNGASGIAVGRGAVVRSCTTTYNGSFGIAGESGAVVENCSSGSNQADGIVVGAVSSISNCAVYLNSGHGIRTSDSSTVRGCTATSSGAAGFLLGSGSTIADCTAKGNTADGILLGSDNTISACTVELNGGNGIIASTGCTITGCASNLNTADGIRTGARCLITGNNCSGNGVNGGNGAGIRVAGFLSRVEGNNCSTSDRGIHIDIGGNIIIRNTCSGNTTNWEIAANNYYGPIIDRTGVAAAVSGSAAATGTLGTTDPNANFTF